jgi:hypothetical protein
MFLIGQIVPKEASLVRRLASLANIAGGNGTATIYTQIEM